MALWEDLTLVTIVLVGVVGGGAAALGSIRAATHSLLDEIHYDVCEGGKVVVCKVL